MRPPRLVTVVAAAVVASVVELWVAACGSAAAGNCARNSDCDDGAVCFAGSCRALPDDESGEGEGEGEGEGGEGEGEGEGEGGEGEGEGEGEGACGDGAVDDGEDCDDGEIGAGDDALDGCRACRVVVADVDVPVGRTSVDGIALPITLARAGARFAVAGANGLYVADVDDALGTIGAFTRVAGRGATPRGLIGSATASVPDDVLFPRAVDGCPDGSLVFLPGAPGRVLRLTPGGDVVHVAGNPDAAPGGPDQDFVLGRDPLQVNLNAATDVACAADGSVILAAGAVVVAIAPDGVVRQVVGRTNDLFEGRNAAERRLLVRVIAVDVAGNGDLLVAVEDDLFNPDDHPMKVLRVTPQGAVTTVLGGGPGALDEGALDTPLPATSVDVINLQQVEDDGEGGFYASHLFFDVWHVDDTGTMRRLGRGAPALGEGASIGLARVGDGVVTRGQGAFVRFDRSTGGGARLGMPQLSVAVAVVAGLPEPHVVELSGGVFAIAGGRPVPTTIGASLLAAGEPVFRAARLGNGRDVLVAGALPPRLVLDGAPPSVLLDLDDALPALAPSALARDVVYLARECSLLRVDTGTLPATPVDLFAGGSCLTSTLGTSVATTRLFLEELIVIPGATDDVIFARTRDDQIVKLPLSTSDGAPAVLAGDLLADDDSGDGGAATVAGFGSLDAFTRRADGSIVVAADGRLRVFAPGGIIAPLAGTAGAGEGFADGPAALARFANVVGLVEDGSDGSLLVVEPTSVRRFDATTGTVSTLVADQFVEDGPLGDARLARPGGIACADGACVVDDDASRTLRRVSFVDGAVATLRGSERAPFDAADVAVRAGAVVASLPSADRIVTLGATADDDVTFAQGNGFVTAPTALCGIADGNAGDVDADADDVLFVSQATTLRRVGAAVAVTLFADASDAIVDVAAEGDDACFVTAGDVRCLAASLVDGGVDDAVSLQASTSATAVAIAAGHVFFADDDGVHRVPLAGGAPVTLVSSGTQALPFAGCVGGLAIDGDAVFATDGCTGSLIRIAFE